MKNTKTVELPKGILKSDTKYPSWNPKSKNRQVYDVGNHGELTFHKTETFGWVIATLPIANARKDFVARTYAVSVEPKPYSTDHQIVTVGNGPHVLSTIKVYITTKRLKALQPFIDTYNKGMASAGNIRDRISTRRANTVMRRSGFGW